MKTYTHLFERLCQWENLEESYWKARKGKSNNPKVQEFEKHWRLHLCTLMRELRTQTYQPRPLQKFVLRDPKTRIICASAFRDRIVHHALVNILQPIFQPRFIHDSYASQKGKGTLAALRRFGRFMRQVTRNGRTVPDAKHANAVEGFALKADIFHYFDTVDHAILLARIAKHVRDTKILWLCQIILAHYHAGIPGKGMPLGNWTSQFFANVYLNELDQFVKHTLKAKYYIRYVDDIVILHKSKILLQNYQQQISGFLKSLKLELHPNKCCIAPLSQGTALLGFRVFYHHTLVRARNIRAIKTKLLKLLSPYPDIISSQYIMDVFMGWNAYALHGNTYRLRERLTAELQRALLAHYSRPNSTISF